MKRLVVLALLVLAGCHGKPSPRCVKQTCTESTMPLLISNADGTFFVMPIPTTDCTCLEYERPDAGDGGP